MYIHTYIYIYYRHIFHGISENISIIVSSSQQCQYQVRQQLFEAAEESHNAAERWAAGGVVQRRMGNVAFLFWDNKRFLWEKFEISVVEILLFKATESVDDIPGYLGRRDKIGCQYWIVEDTSRYWRCVIAMVLDWDPWCALQVQRTQKDKKSRCRYQNWPHVCSQTTMKQPWNNKQPVIYKAVWGQGFPVFRFSVPLRSQVFRAQVASWRKWSNRKKWLWTLNATTRWRFQLAKVDPRCCGMINWG